jgi:hypothetical protein
MQPFAALQIEEEGGGCTGADTECEICVGAYFPGHKVATGRHGRDVSWPCITVPFNRWLGDSGRSRGSVMGTVLSLRLARERAWQSATELEAVNASSQRLLERLETENAQLRGSVVELVLQIQALRDGLGDPQSETQPNRCAIGLRATDDDLV